MSSPDVVDTGGAVYDDPNREAVGLDPAWVEGTGGDPGEPPMEAEPAVSDTAADLDAMTKDQLLAYAQQIGASPANAAMTKDELKASIQAAGG
jgi:hypothetical protein